MFYVANLNQTIDLKSLICPTKNTPKIQDKEFYLPH